MPKPIPINRPCPKGRDSRFALLPIGMYCNKAIQTAPIGSIIEFCTDWRRDKATLIRKCKIPVNSPVFTFLAKSIYGEYTRIKDLLERWENLSIIEGYGRGGVDKEFALLIEVKMCEE